jgi:hypothetical protein
MRLLVLAFFLSGCASLPAVDQAGFPRGSVAQRYCLDFPSDPLCK